MYSSRPNFKKHIKDFSSYVHSSLTFYAIDLLKAKNAPANEGYLKSSQNYNVIDSKTNKTLT